MRNRRSVVWAATDAAAYPRLAGLWRRIFREAIGASALSEELPGERHRILLVSASNVRGGILSRYQISSEALRRHRSGISRWVRHEFRGNGHCRFSVSRCRRQRVMRAALSDPPSPHGTSWVAPGNLSWIMLSGGQRSAERRSRNWSRDTDHKSWKSAAQLRNCLGPHCVDGRRPRSWVEM
jgi:hypothetical protein